MSLSQLASQTTCSAQSISYPSLPSAQIRSLEATIVQKGWRVVPAGLYTNNGPVSASSLSFCNVTVTYTPLGTSRVTTVQVWLPTKGWNERIQGAGGGGWAAGLHDTGLASMEAAVIQGYATMATNSGHPPGTGPENWAMSGPGKVDLNDFQHYATTSLNDLAIIGKSVVNSFYGRPQKYAYWNGCSQGGRQGFMLAQKYPKAFDGIVASAPVVLWGQLMVAGFWSQTTMHELGEYPRPCELSALTAAAIAHCDGDDGLFDGLNSDPDSCNFDPFTLVNTTASCGFGVTRKISHAAAYLANTQWTGMRKSVHPYMYDGAWHQASLVTEGSVPYVSALLPALNYTTGLADSECFANGTCVGKPFPIVNEWIKYFVQKDPNYDTTNILQKDFDRIFQESVDEYHPIIGTDDPDLSAFRDAGGKILSYHGLADSIIPSKNTRRYYKMVMAQDEAVHDYYRHFEAPGVGHCYTGTGLYPASIFDSMVKWVETGQKPDVLEVDTSTLLAKRTRILCPYPQRSRYNGTDGSLARSDFYCA